jgi:hypothetical protein
VRLLALDPGSERTGWIVVDAAASDALPVVGSGKWPNEEVLDRLRHNDGALTAEVTIIEAMSPRGMPTSRQDLETVHWAGRFYEAASRWHRVERVEREHVKRHLIGSQRPKGGPNADRLSTGTAASAARLQLSGSKRVRDRSTASQLTRGQRSLSR